MPKQRKMTEAQARVLERYEREYAWIDYARGTYHWGSRRTGDGHERASARDISRCWRDGLIEIGYMAEITPQGRAALAAHREQKER